MICRKLSKRGDLVAFSPTNMLINSFDTPAYHLMLCTFYACYLYGYFHANKTISDEEPKSELNKSFVRSVSEWEIGFSRRIYMIFIKTSHFVSYHLSYDDFMLLFKAFSIYKLLVHCSELFAERKEDAQFFLFQNPKLIGVFNDLW